MSREPKFERQWQFCPNCHKTTATDRELIHFGCLHTTLGILTLGIWILLYTLVQSFTPRERRCLECGKSYWR